MFDSTFSSFVTALRHRREMYLPAGDDPYGLVVAALIGFDQATHGGALVGFREWLVVKFNGLSSFSWDSIVTTILSTRKTLDSNERINFLLDMIEEYVDERNSKGIVSIFFAYRDWRDVQPWAEKVPPY